MLITASAGLTTLLSSMKSPRWLSSSPMGVSRLWGCPPRGARRAVARARLRLRAGGPLPSPCSLALRAGGGPTPGAANGRGTAGSRAGDPPATGHLRHSEPCRKLGEMSDVHAAQAPGMGYNLAWLAHRQNRYHHAREGYLATLRADSHHLDARYNLALLVHTAGATLEAKHHLEQLKAVAPAGDERVRKLENALGQHGTPVPSAGATFAVVPTQPHG
jgi:hypothetical protein